MPNLRYILTTLVVACILGAGFLANERLEDPLAGKIALASAGLFALAIIRSTLLRPYLITRLWQNYGAERGYNNVVGRHGEPRMVGDIDGLRFIVAQSTSLLSGGGGYYSRTVVTAAIEEGVPDGFRLYRRDALEWMHHLSGLREVTTDDPDFDERFMIEGSDASATAAWVGERRAIFAELAENYPRSIVYGSEIDGLPAAAGGASGAVTLIVVGRTSSAAKLDEFIGAACGFARALDSRST